MLVAITMQATNIDRQQATRLARDFMSKNFSKKLTRQAYQTVPLNSVETGQSLLHAFNVEGGGFVIVAGDDCAPAILGYSETSVIDPSDLPDGLKELFAQYKPQMKKLTKNQGKMLIKLINRETNQSSYSIVKAFLGTFRAGFWQTFSKFFGASLKQGYHPAKNKQDAMIERICIQIEQGTL